MTSWLMQLLGLPKDALHIYIGLSVFLLCAVLFRWPLRSWRPFAAVLVVALGLQAWDVVDSILVGVDPLWGQHWHGVWNICFWPAVLFLLARYTRLLRI